MLDLSDNLLTGDIPPEIESLNRLRELRLSGNLLTGAIPSGLESLTILRKLSLSDNALTGCVPVGLRQVGVNDLTELDMPYCDVLISSLVISPGELNQEFDPYRRHYTAWSFSSQITVGAASDPDASQDFLDNLSRLQSDADTATPGHQVDLSPGVTFTRLRWYPLTWRRSVFTRCWLQTETCSGGMTQTRTE